jgi:hypothetical protein
MICRMGVVGEGEREREREYERERERERERDELIFMQLLIYKNILIIVN